MRWDLDDLAATGDLAREFEVSASTVVAWINRYPTFPAPLVRLSNGALYSKRAVRLWHDSRTWSPGRHTGSGRSGG